jgi:hypothetical protein
VIENGLDDGSRISSQQRRILPWWHPEPFRSTAVGDLLLQCSTKPQTRATKMRTRCWPELLLHGGGEISSRGGGAEMLGNGMRSGGVGEQAQSRSSRRRRSDPRNGGGGCRIRTMAAAKPTPVVARSERSSDDRDELRGSEDWDELSHSGARGGKREPEIDVATTGSTGGSKRRRRDCLW